MGTIDQKRLELMNRYWNAANYLTVGQIYLQANPLLREATASRTYQAAFAGSLGNISRS